MLRNGRKITKQRPGFAHILKMYLPHNKIMSLLSSLVSETMIGEACCTHNTKRHSSVVSFAPTVLRPQVRIPSTPSTLFSICIIEIVLRK